MSSLQWLQFTLSYALQATFVLCMAWALERWSQASETKTRVWTGCFVSLLGLLTAGLLLPRLHWVQPWSQLSPKSLLTVTTVQDVLGRSLMAVWILGSSIMLARWVFQFWSVRRFIHSCPKIDLKDQKKLETLVKGDLLKPGNRTVEFRASPEDLGPFCYQFHQPIVFLPPSLIHGYQGELQHVLLHELTHLETQHPVQLFAQKLVQVVLWFHPLVWMSAQRANLVREFVCDDAATCDRTSTASYLRTLLHFVEHRSAPQSSTLAIGRTSSELKLRARRLLTQTGYIGSRWKSASCVGVLITALIVSQAWLPTNPLASPRAMYSPWPSWSAAALHTFGLEVRDFETFEPGLQMHELLESSADPAS
jgi:beta-lactamase regulating signal transducer with metallopeptidase domain